jgi:hypothetical protein
MFLEINVKFFEVFIIGVLLFVSINSVAVDSKNIDISHIISKDEFSKYSDVGDFIDRSPKVTINVKAKPRDIAKYGTDVVKSLTGSDCDRDGEMDSNTKCNAVYYKLWMKYER